MKSHLTPPMQKGKEPPFYEMGAMPFQELCRDLLAVQGEFIECRIYGDNGEGQLGIDIRCDRKNQQLEVAQSKCYKEYPPAEIIKASNKFFENIEYWLREGVQKFFLITACRISSRKANDQIVIERQRFKKFGIDYELWDAVRIRDILRDHCELISTHIENDDYWARNICGIVSTSPYSNHGNFGINQLLATSVNDLSTVINTKASEELEENRLLWREGKKKQVIEWIHNKKTSLTEWKVVSDGIRAGIIRLEAITYIDYFEDYEKAEQLLQEAKEIDPKGLDNKFWAILTLHRSGPEAGLQAIGDATDLDSTFIRASLLLQLDRYNEALALLEPIQDRNDAEVFRLLALTFLEARDISKAREAIAKAKKMAGSWENIQIADAVISYFSAQSPAAFSRTITVWPEPVELDLVKSTNDAINALDHAAEIFLQISRNEFINEAYRLSCKVWYAACLASDFRKQNEANDYFSQLLAEHPTDHRLISWILDRNFSEELQTSRHELKKRREKGLASPADIISSVMLDIHDRRLRNTIHLLERFKSAFIEESLEHLWDFWYIQTLISQKKLGEAQRRMLESVYRLELKQIQLQLLNQECIKSGNYQPMVDRLLSYYENESDSVALMELCQYYAAKQKWSDLGVISERLVSEIQTVEAYRLATITLYNLGRFQDCKLFIEKHRSLCFNSNLPSDLILIYIQSKALSGEFPEALSDLRQLTESNPTKQNLFLLRDFYIQKGDEAGLRYVATLAKVKSNLKPDELISFANSLLWTSRDLAKELLRMAPSDQLSSQHLVEKMALGFSLGLDNEIRDIHTLLPQIMQEKDAPIRTITLEETIEIIKRRNQQRNELFSRYSIGELPIHVLAQNAGFNLFAFYKNVIRINSDSSTSAGQKLPLYIRFGGQPSLTDFKEPETPFDLNRIALDITSLLFLDHYSLLDIFEGIGNPIRLPRETVVALVQMNQELEHYQPEIVQASKLISEYLGENKIKQMEINPIQFGEDYSENNLLQNYISSLVNQDGYLVGFSSQLVVWNGLNRKGVDLKFITSTDIVDSLRKGGIITEAERNLALDRLGTEGQIRINTFVPPGSNLFFIANTINQLAQTEVFSQVCNNYGVSIESNEVFSIRSSLREERDRLAFSTKLHNLIERISHGLDDRKYSFLPYQRVESNHETQTQNDIYLRNLFENIFSGQRQNLIPVIDDFYIQKQLLLQGAQVIGVYELLWSAYKHGIIDKAHYFDILINFRKADIRYLPISSDEINFHLQQASIEKNSLIEDANLKTLRIYISSSLIYGKNLQNPSQPFNSVGQLGEFEYVLSFVHSVASAITKIWQDGTPEDQKIIRSTWIIDYLFLDLLTICNVTGWDREQKDHVFLVALSLSEFFLNGLQFLKDDSNSSPRKKYYDWFYRTICEQRFNANPGLLEKTAEFIKNSLASQISDHDNTELNPYVRLFCERLYRDLPGPIKVPIEKDKEFLRSIGIEIITVIDIAGIMFAAYDFWNKFFEVLRGIPTKILALEPKIEILFSPWLDKARLGGTFTHPVSGQNINVESNDFIFLTNEDLQVWVDRNEEDFCELSRNELQKYKDRIALAISPAEKMGQLDELRKTSIGVYYKNFREELISTQTLHFDHLLPPTKQGLNQFFGLDYAENTPTRVLDLLDLSARNLKNRLGLSTAIARISGFPIELPIYLLEEIKNLTVVERNSLLKNLSADLVTPISRLHFIRILNELGDEEKIIGLTRSFFSEGVNNEITAFLLLNTLITDELDSLPGEENWSQELKLLLSWGHSNQLFTIFKEASVPFDWLITVLREKKSNLPFRYIFSKPPLEWEDIVYGGRLDTLPFKILGLNYSLDGMKIFPTDLQKKLLDEIFPWQENIALPSLDLLEDRGIFTNTLGTFFGDDISDALLNFIPQDDERILTLSSSSLRNLAVQAIAWLSNPLAAAAGWQFLFGIYHNQALPDTLVSAFESNAGKFNFVELANENPSIGFLGFYFSTCQAKQLSESAKTYLHNQLTDLVEAGSKLPCESDSSDQHPIRKDEIIALLLESAIRLSLAQSNDRIIEEFGYLIKEIITHWKDAKTISLHLLNRLYQEVPIPIAQKFGKTLLELRSLK